MGQPSLPTLKPSPRLRLMPTMAITTAMDWPTTDTGTLTMATTATPMPTMATTTARGPLMLSQRLMLTMDIMGTDLPTTDTGMYWLTMATTAPMLTPTPTDTTTARGPLMLGLRLMLTTAITTVMLLTVMPTVDTTAILMPTMATTATITESNL